MDKRFLLVLILILAGFNVALPQNDKEQKGGFYAPHSGIDFYVGTGINAKDGSSSIPFEAVISKELLTGLTVGLGSGYEPYKGEGITGGGSVPVFLDGKAVFPFAKRLGIFGDLRLGGSFGSDIEVKVGKKTQKISGGSGFLLAAMPGFRVGLGSCIDLDLAFGYMMLASSEGTSNMAAARVGLNFHKASKPKNYYPLGSSGEKEKKIYPTRNKGFELGVEGWALNGYGAGLLLGYKVSPKLSLGLEFAITGYKSYSMPEYTIEYFKEPDGKGDCVATVQSNNSDDRSFDGTWIKFLIRGQYRFLEKTVSPIARLDVGYKSNSDGIRLERKKIESDSFYDDTQSVNGFYVNPAVGISWRCSRNGYLEAAIGYDIMKGISSIDKIYNQSGNYGGSGSKHFNSIRLKEGGVNLSGINISLSWKYTIQWLSGAQPINKSDNNNL